jgi:hypothetical protein
MESRTQLLTLKLLIFEVTDGCNRMLADDVAEQFVLLFGPASPWRSTIRRVDFGGMHGHYEASSLPLCAARVVVAEDSGGSF